MTADAELFSALYASLDARKDPWRNGTNHPDRVYTAEEAQIIFHATKKLVQDIAQRCDENGDPKV